MSYGFIEHFGNLLGRQDKGRGAQFYGLPWHTKNNCAVCILGKSYGP